MIDHVMLEAIEKWAEIHAQEFTTVARDSENKIMFCLPIPGYKEDLSAEDGVDKATEAWWEYVISQMTEQLTETKKTYRTREKAGELAVLPGNITLITNPTYQNAISAHKDDTAYFAPLSKSASDTLKFDENTGKLYIAGIEASKIELTKISDRQRLSEIDLPLLQALYSIIMQDLLKDGPEAFIEKASDREFWSKGGTVKIYMPDFLEMIGRKRNIKSEEVNALKDKVSSFNNILGVMDERLGNRILKSTYPVMIFGGYNAAENAFSIRSPYINRVIQELVKNSIRRDKHGEIQRSKSGRALTSVTHSYLVHSDIIRERNKNAVEIVFAIVVLIEQAGDNIPRIKASTIIDRCEGLKLSIENTKSPSNKNRLLERAFSKAWKLLDTHTDLKKVYKNIVFPNTIPTMKTLDMVFEFPHNGKKK